MSVTFSLSGKNGDAYCNFANTNAQALIEMLGYEFDYCGEWEPEQLPELRRRIIKAQNVERVRGPFLEDPYAAGGPGTGRCRIVSGGVSDEQIQRRLGYLLEVVLAAAEQQCSITWG